MIINNSEPQGFKYILAKAKTWKSEVGITSRHFFDVDGTKLIRQVLSQDFHIFIIALYSCHLRKLSYANLLRTSLHFEQCLQIVMRDSQCGLIVKLWRGPSSPPWLCTEKNPKLFPKKRRDTERRSRTLYIHRAFEGWYSTRKGDILGLSIIDE